MPSAKPEKNGKDTNLSSSSSSSSNNTTSTSTINTTPSTPPPSQDPQTNTPNPPPIPFSRIIEADHTNISHLATQTTKPNIPTPLRLTHLTTLLCRLIRHDISEELVMRPAFKTHMGDEGASFAERDRVDHADLKGRLLALYEGIGRGRNVDDDDDDWVRKVEVLCAEMAGHMREESGVMLPRLEGVLAREVSLELGGRYARTLVLTPGVRDGEGGEVCFEDVTAYVRADVGVFRGVLDGLERREREGVDQGYFRRRVVEELAVLGLVNREKKSDRVRGSTGSREKL